MKTTLNANKTNKNNAITMNTVSGKRIVVNIVSIRKRKRATA